MDVLLIQPPIRDFYLTAKRTIPYGLACIAASLRKAGFSVSILDALAVSKSRSLPLPQEMSHLKDFYGRPDISPFCLFHEYRHYGYSFQHIRKQIKASGAFLVGISALFTAYADEAMKTADEVRAALPDCKIVVGGHHPTAMPGHVMKWESVDYAIRGEGEVAMPILADVIRYKKDISEVPGIVFRKSGDSIQISEPAIMADLDAWPLPDRNRINNAHYTRGRYPSTVVVTSRGCPLHCSYCALGNQTLYPYRTRSVESVLLEIEDAVENHAARFIDFEDENLSYNKKWFMTLLAEISHRFEKKGLELRAMNGLYPPTLDDGVISAMKTADFKTLNLSLGAACPAQLDKFRRADVRTDFENCLSLAEKHSLDTVGYVICSAPNQTANQSLEDLLYLAERRVLAGLSVFYPAPGSRDYDSAKHLDLLPEHLSLFRSSALPISHTTSRLESITLLRLARIVNFMKALIDQGRKIPRPDRMLSDTFNPPFDRQEIGERLLAGFLYDGRIRGITPDGQIYTHFSDDDLSRQFLSRLKDASVVGVKGDVSSPIV